MEEMFNKLKTEGRNTLDNIMKWLKDSDILGKTKDEESNALKLFDSVQNKANIDFAEFTGVLSKLAESQKHNMEDLTKKLTDSGPDVLKALQGAASTAVAVGVANVANAVQGLGK